MRIVDFLRVIVVCSCLFLAVPLVHASTYVAVEDTLVYDLLTRLEVEGVIRSGLLDTKPISRKEAFRLLHEAETSSEDRSEFIKDLVRSLKEGLGPESTGTQIKPIDRAYAAYVHTNAEVHTLKYGSAQENEQPLNVNNNGDLYRRGSNERVGFTSRLEDWGPLSIEINPEFRYPETPFTEERFVTKKAYGVVDLWGWDLVLGQDSQWWGPGYHGALLLTNNAEPFTMLKVTNPEPVHLPWIFNALGPFRLNFFVTNLEKARTVPKPYLYGLRFDFKPHPNIEIGLEKTALLGGQKGRPEDISVWLHSFYGANEADNCFGSTSYCFKNEPGDQRAGVDFKFTVPWHVQPMQVYLEAAGEDEYRNLPTDWAFVGGFYLPRILNADRFDFRLEFATTRGKMLHPYKWYVHHIYESYTYEGNIIGHHIGTDSNDLFTEVSYLMPERNGRLFLSYDREEHNLYVAGSHETLYDISGGIITSLTKHVDLSARYSRGWLHNLGNAPHETLHLSAFGVEFGYSF